MYDDSIKGLHVWDAERGERLLTIPLGDSPNHLWFDRSGQSVNAAFNGQPPLTIRLPRCDFPFEDVGSLVRFLTGQRIDETDGMEFVDPFTFKKNLDHYRSVFRRWKGLPADGK